MPSDIKPITLVIVATLATACSATPRTAEPAVGTAAQPQPAPQAVAAANHASAAARAPAGDVDASLVKEGYSVLRRRDQVLYCRTEIITGNRIATRICLTAAQIQDQKHDLVKSKDLLNGASLGHCVGSTCAD
jgi:hypothetical protein